MSAGRRNLTIAREEIGAGIIFTRRRDGDFAVQTSHATAEINLTHVSVGIGRVAIEGEKFRSFIRLFSRTVEHDEVDNAGNGIRAVNGRSAILQDFRARKCADRNQR